MRTVLSCLAVLVVISVGTLAQGDPVDFPDADLEAAVLAEIGKSPGDTIYEDDLIGLTELDCQYDDVRDLTGIEHCVDLEWLHLGTNRSLSDLSPLSGLSNLEYLHVGVTGVSNLSPISGLTKIRELYFVDTNVSSVAPLSGLNRLERTAMYGSDVTDLSPLNGLSSLVYVHAERCKITNISGMENVTSLVTFRVAGNRLDLACASNPAMQTIQSLIDNGTAKVTYSGQTSPGSNPDSTPPTNPTITSSSHDVGVESSESSVSISVSGASDNCSVDGFEYEWTQSATWTPTHVKMVEENWSGATFDASDGDWYFHIAAVDVSGFWSNPDQFGPVTIVSPVEQTLTVISPNGGEQWAGGTSQQIRWASTNATSSVIIEYSTDGCSLSADWQDVVSTTPNDGAYTWMVPDEHSSDCCVRISTLDGEIQDTSNNTFTIFSGDPVDFPDADLEAAVLAEIGKSPGDTIYEDDLIGLTELDCQYDDVRDLTGIEHCVDLEWLHLGTNRSLSDLSPLSGLSNLEYLHVGVTGVSNLSPISGLTKIRELYFVDTNVSSVAPLSGLNRLERTAMYGSDVTDLSPLNGLSSLVYVHAERCKITNISGMENVTSLVTFRVAGNRLDLACASNPAMQTIQSLIDNGTAKVTYSGQTSPGSNPDSTPPTNPTITSSSHDVGVESSESSVSISVSGASDNCSVDGFEYEWTQSATWTPTHVKMVEETWTGRTFEASEGSWYFHIATTDVSGIWSTATALGPFNIALMDSPPLPSAGGPYMVHAGTTRMLYASESTDADISSFSWDLDNDGIFETPGEVVEFQSGVVGEHIVAVRVEDARGNIADAYTSIEVTNAPPVPPHSISISLTDGIVAIEWLCADEDSDPLSYSIQANDELLVAEIQHIAQGGSAVIELESPQCGAAREIQILASDPYGGASESQPVLIYGSGCPPSLTIDSIEIEPFEDHEIFRNEDGEIEIGVSNAGNEDVEVWVGVRLYGEQGETWTHAPAYAGVVAGDSSSTLESGFILPTHFTVGALGIDVRVWIGGADVETLHFESANAVSYEISLDSDSYHIADRLPIVELKGPIGGEIDLNAGPVRFEWEMEDQDGDPLVALIVLRVVGQEECLVLRADGGNLYRDLDTAHLEFEHDYEWTVLVRDESTLGKNANSVGWDDMQSLATTFNEHGWVDSPYAIASPKLFSISYYDPERFDPARWIGGELEDIAEAYVLYHGLFSNPIGSKKRMSVTQSVRRTISERKDYAIAYVLLKYMQEIDPNDYITGNIVGIADDVLANISIVQFKNAATDEHDVWQSWCDLIEGTPADQEGVYISGPRLLVPSLPAGLDLVERVYAQVEESWKGLPIDFFEISKYWMQHSLGVGESAVPCYDWYGGSGEYSGLCSDATEYVWRYIYNAVPDLRTLADSFYRTAAFNAYNHVFFATDNQIKAYEQAAKLFESALDRIIGECQNVLARASRGYVTLEAPEGTQLRVYDVDDSNTQQELVGMWTDYSEPLSLLPGEYRFMLWGGQAAGLESEDFAELHDIKDVRVAIGDEKTIEMDRKLPRCVGYQLMSASGEPIPTGGTLESGSEVEGEFTIKHDMSLSFIKTRITWIMDREGVAGNDLVRTSDEFLSTPVVPKLLHSSATLEYPGDYSRSILVEAFLDEEWHVTDSWDWGEEISVLAPPSLGVIVQDLDGTTFRGARVELRQSISEDSEGAIAITGEGGLAEFSNLQEGDYEVLVFGGYAYPPGKYNANPPHELWALRQVHVSPGPNDEIIRRDMPHFDSIEFATEYGGTGMFTRIDPAVPLLPGEDIFGRAFVHNPTEEPFACEVKVVLDRSKSGNLDADISEGGTVGAGLTVEIVDEFDDLTIRDLYYRSARLRTKVSGDWYVTDTWAWAPAVSIGRSENIPNLYVSGIWSTRHANGEYEFKISISNNGTGDSGESLALLYFDRADSGWLGGPMISCPAIPRDGSVDVRWGPGEIPDCSVAVIVVIDSEKQIFELVEDDNMSSKEISRLASCEP
ncbi:hypothetical protein ACFLSG_03615 [Candidatus Bipolaricaulota bacterium]